MLADAFAQELPTLRGQAEALMQDIFTVYAPSAGTTDADGMESSGYTTQGTTKGKLQSRTGGIGNAGDTSTKSIDLGGITRYVVEGGLHLPVDAPAPAYGGVGTGWEYVLTSAGPSTPNDLVGSRWLVVDSPGKSYMTARRLDVVRLA